MRQLKISQKITNRESEALEKYLNDIAKIDQLTPEQEVSLAKRIQQGDHAALDEMVKANLRFVVSVAKQYQNNGLTLNDLINEGNVGLLKAARRFDETKGFKFITYAVWWIRQAILTAIIENSRMIRLPHNKHHLTGQINQAYQDFLQHNEREPNPEELAEVFGLSSEEISSVLESNARPVSLDAPLNDEEGSGAILDILGDNSEGASPDMGLMGESLKKEIQFAMRSLSPREREVVSALYGLEENSPRTIDEVAQIFGLSFERVRQIREHAFRRMKKSFRRANFSPFES
ncbi:MAG TPA: RNA polymerase sigma factor RpoD/SigA [Saprospiraceae bacterium]|nr:RNA polymerase sigma factor RpoD/SigA [Saprospiraceae bacterium]